MELNDFIVAIDLGSSKITGIVGKFDKTTVLEEIQVFAIESENSGSCIKRGIIQNIDEASVKVNNLIAKLERKINAKIARVHLCIGGQSIRSVDKRVTQDFGDDTLISEFIVNSLINKSKEAEIPGKSVLQVIPVEYFTDGKSAGKNVVGTYCSELSAIHKLIIGDSVIMKNIKRLAQNITVEVGNIHISPLMTESVLSESDKNFGCAVIDFGAATTSVTIYKNGSLAHVGTIPFGGNNITSDLVKCLHILLTDAENLKIDFGNANSDSHEKDNQILISKENRKEIQRGEIHKIVYRRSEEIVENIMNQIKFSGFEKDLAAGFTFLGNASQMKGLQELFNKKTPANIKMGSCQKSILWQQDQNLYKSLSLQSLFGILMKEKENCCKFVEVKVKEPEVIQAEPEPAQIVDTNNEHRKDETVSHAKEPQVRKDTDKGTKRHGLFGKLAGGLKIFIDDDGERETD